MDNGMNNLTHQVKLSYLDQIILDSAIGMNAT